MWPVILSFTVVLGADVSPRHRPNVLPIAMAGPAAESPDRAVSGLVAPYHQQPAGECVTRDSSTRLVPAPPLADDESATWSDSVKRSIRAHRVCPGMSLAMLRAAWGLPEGYDEQITAGFSTRQDKYPRHVVIAENARVVAIRLRPATGR